MSDARVVAGRYRLIAKLGEGGTGSVWSAEHTQLKCPAAVKLLSSVFAESPESLARFKRAVQSAASLRSTNIVQILDFGIDEGTPFIAMELLRGHSLADRLRAEHTLEPRETAVILSQVASAVTWAHGMEIVHRDLKPGNIFLSQEAGNVVVRLLDFCIGRPLPIEVGETPTGKAVGTPHYMSPELASGRHLVDHRTDIWSFGTIAYECITGRRAFTADTLGALVRAICTDPMPVPSESGRVPRGFDEWFARCSHRDPGRRFLSIAEAADILSFICGLEPNATLAMPQLYSEPPPNPERHPRVWRRSLPPGVSTDAPATLSLRSGASGKRGTRVVRVTRAVLGGILTAAAGLAILARLGHGGSAPPTAVARQGLENSVVPQPAPDAGTPARASLDAAAHAPNVTAGAASTTVNRALGNTTQASAQFPLPAGNRLGYDDGRERADTLQRR